MHYGSPWWQDPITLSTMVIACATVLNLGISFFMWLATYRSMNITKNIFDAAHRPYVGVLGNSISLIRRAAQREIQINVKLKNSVTVSANLVKYEISIFLDGKISCRRFRKGPATLFPQEVLTCGGALPVGDQYDRICNSESKVEVGFSLRYKGSSPTEHHHTVRRGYKHETDSFVIVEDFTD